MAIPKVLGIETEYGIMCDPGEDQNPTAASSLLINAYLDSLTNAGLASNRHRVAWDFSDESPDADARGVLAQFALPPEVETHLVNAVLTNGARYYVDHAHPEYSSPEVSNPIEAVIWDRAGEVIVQRSMEAVTAQLQGTVHIRTYKNNSDGKGNSYGCHENFIVDRATPFPAIVRGLTPHLITRQVFCGAGKLGYESPHEFGIQDGFQVSQRADFFEEEVGLETTLKRPIINTRDEPHADAAKYRRLHVIIGDANLSEWATMVKLGSTALVLCCIEDGVLTEDLRPRRPIQALRHISSDTDLSYVFETMSGRRLTALDTQEILIDTVSAWAERGGFDTVGGSEIGQRIVDEWRKAIVDLRDDPIRTVDRIEWVAKKRLLERYADRHGLPLSHPKVAAVGIQYHDLRPGKGLAAKMNYRSIVTAADIDAATVNAPETTRAWFRGECLKRFPDAVVAANWDSLVIDSGRPRLQRIPMMEPLKGTRAVTHGAFDHAGTVDDVLRWLDA